MEVNKRRGHIGLLTLGLQDRPLLRSSRMSKVEYSQLLARSPSPDNEGIPSTTEGVYGAVEKKNKRQQWALLAQGVVILILAAALFARQLFPQKICSQLLYCKWRLRVGHLESLPSILASSSCPRSDIL